MPELSVRVTPSLVVAVFLLLRELAPDWKKWPRTVAEALSLAGSGKAQAYEMLRRLRDLLPSVVGTPGRPASQPSDDKDATIAILVAIRNYLATHPGAICGAGERCTYSDGFRRLIVGLTDPGKPGQGMSTADLAFASGVPLGTLKDWLHPRQAGAENPDAHCSPGPTEGGVITPAPAAAAAPAAPAGLPPSQDTEVEAEPAPHCELLPADDAETVPAEAEDAVVPETVDALASATVRGTHLEQIVDLWKSWSGSFQAFCKMLRTEQRMQYGDTFIGNLLQSLGLRQRRPRRPVEAPWSSGTFRALFPGAQWLGDGTDIDIRWGDKLFVFNLEAMLDVATTATMGIDVSKSESEKSLHHAYEEGKITSGGAPPLATMLDNKNCNHSPDAQAALEDTVLLRATPDRGQAKAPLEGAFGLFQQDLPPLVVADETPEEMAASVLRLIACAYFRGRNGRPRKRLKGCTPAQAYTNAKPTPEEIEEARKWFQELQRRQERARLTREARRDPVRIQLLIQGLAELGIPDPDQRLTISLAYYAREAIVRGLSTFRTKLELGTVPPDADHGRYLGGIIRQLHTRLELERMSVYLMEQRIRMQDFTLTPLERAARQIRADMPLPALPQAFVDHALAATYAVDFRFWTHAAADALLALPAAHRSALYQPLCRRIAASFKTDRERREDLIDRMAEVLAEAA